MSSPFAPKTGCPMCGIVAYASTSTAILSYTPADHIGPLPRSGRDKRNKDKSKPDILYRDDNFTIYEEKEYAVSSRGHLVVCFNLHVDSLYSLASSDIPLLNKLQETATRLLSYFTDSPNPSPLASPSLRPQQLGVVPPSPMTPSPNASFHLNAPPTQTLPLHIGFITPPFKDPKIPISDHLHAHAFIGDMDLVKWYDVHRKIVYHAGWWDVADLIAEIREQTSNNRVKSGGSYSERRMPRAPSDRHDPSTFLPARPISMVPNAGAREGLPNGLDVTAPSITVQDLEVGNDTLRPEDDMPTPSGSARPSSEWGTMSSPGTTVGSVTPARPLTPQPSTGSESTDRMLLQGVSNSSSRGNTSAGIGVDVERPISALSI